MNMGEELTIKVDDIDQSLNGLNLNALNLNNLNLRDQQSVKVFPSPIAFGAVSRVALLWI